jgi:hypothetical protein
MNLNGACAMPTAKERRHVPFSDPGRFWLERDGVSFLGCCGLDRVNQTHLQLWQRLGTI